jgi:peptide/nickel transport system permease protein
MSRTSYVIARLIIAVPMVLLLLTLVFVVMHIIPGDPVRAMYGTRVSEEFARALRHEMGLDKPLYSQYIDYVLGIFTGNLGMSMWSKRPVISEVLSAFPVTLELTILGMILSVIIGLSLGVACALKRDTVFDHVVRFLSLAGYCVPVFVTGLLEQFIFGVVLHVLPVQGRFNPLTAPPLVTNFAIIDSLLTGNIMVFWDSLTHLVLPALGLAIWWAGLVARVSRASMIETLGEDYIMAARAKGLAETAVISRHALKNAILPVVTLTGICFAVLLGGEMLTETIFSIPGMGRLMINAVFRRDFLVIQGCITFYAISAVVVGTIVDVLYTFLDPRVSN